MTDTTQLSDNNSTAETTDTTADYYYIARHNNTIIGIFDTQADAQDAINGYTMSTNVDLNDTLDIWQSTPAQ